MGVAGFEGGFEPFLLFGSPEGFAGTVVHPVRRAEVAAFGEPDLEVFADPDGPVGRAFLVTHRCDRKLLAEEIDSRHGEGEFVFGIVGVVVAEVVVVLRPIGGNVLEEIDEAGEAELFVPALAEFRDGGGIPDGVVVVDDIAGSDEEVGLDRGHGGECGEA